MQTNLLIFLFGGLGCLTRYMLSARLAIWFQRNAPWEGFPWGTLGVNWLGSLLIGFIMAWGSARLDAGGNLQGFWRPALVTGFLGGFTTFSAFSFETMRMLERGAAGQAILYAMLSVVGTVALVFAGWRLAGILAH